MNEKLILLHTGILGNEIVDKLTRDQMYEIENKLIE